MTDEIKTEEIDANEATIAVETARARRNGGTDEIIMLSTGVRARLRPVAAFLVDEATSKVKRPEVPTVYIAEKDREEPNPLDPAYLQAVDDAAHRRGTVAIDVMVMFGVELPDGLPQDDTWLRQLRILAKHGALDLTAFDLDDELEREFLYKRYIAVGSDDLAVIASNSGIKPEGVAKAKATFQRDKKRGAD